MPQNEIDPDASRTTIIDDLDVPPSRFSMMTGTLVAIGVVTLLIFTGVIWYAFNAGVNQAEDGSAAGHKSGTGRHQGQAG